MSTRTTSPIDTLKKPTPGSPTHRFTVSVTENTDEDINDAPSSTATRLGDREKFAISYIVLGAISLFLRLILIDFTDKKTPVFDEKHYAVQAEQMLHNGGLESNPGYGLVVHPPLGKWLISIGEYLFGYGAIGWRFSSIVAGVLIVLMVMRITHLITGSVIVTSAAGLITNLEATQLFMSRIAMLDVFMAFFITAISFCLVSDHYQDNDGVPLLQRWWLLTSGVLCGMAMAVKISGVYYPALLGVLMVLVAAVSSKSVRYTLRALGAGLVFYLVVPLMVFVTCWLPWFGSENSVYRHIAEAGKIEHPLPEWLAGVLPDSINSFFSYQIGVMSFHTSLESGSGIDNFHPWESKPLDWLLAGRPMLFLSSNNIENPWYGGEDMGIQRTFLFGNVAVWCLLIPVVLWGIYRLIALRGKHIGWAVVVGGILVGTIPWFIAYDRQQYFFYVVSWTMFLSLGVALMLYDWALSLAKKTGWSAPKSMLTVYVPYLLVALGVFIVYLPWMYGITMPIGYNIDLTLFDSWKEFKGYK